MARAKNRDWTREEAQRILLLDEKATHLAEVFGVKISTIYGIRKEIRDIGGIDNWLEHKAKLKPRRDNKAGTANKIILPRGVFKVRKSASGRSGTVDQYTVTLPRDMAESFVETFGDLVEFEALEIGILIKKAMPKEPVREVFPWEKNGKVPS